MKEVKKQPKQKSKKIQIKNDLGKNIVVGEYNSDTKTFTCKRKKSEHFMRKFNAWGLDQKVVDFLVKEGATVHLKDSEDKWEYEVKAVDFKLYGVQGQFGEHKSQIFLDVNKWKVVKMKNRACILKCGEIDCRFNFALNCMSGSIVLGREGNCESYEDK